MHKFIFAMGIMISFFAAVLSDGGNFIFPLAASGLFLMAIGLVLAYLHDEHKREVR